MIRLEEDEKDAVCAALNTIGVTLQADRASLPFFEEQCVRIALEQVLSCNRCNTPEIRRRMASALGKLEAGSPPNISGEGRRAGH